jgi:L,D-transpeptidase YcbB
MRGGSRGIVVLMATAAVVLTGCGREAQRNAGRQAAAELQRALAGRAPAYILAHHEGPRIWKMAQKFYADRGYEPAWIDGTRPRRHLDSLLRALEDTTRHGLDPALYDLGPLSEARSDVRRNWFGVAGFEPEVVAPVDLRLTAAWLAYAHDLATGVTARPSADALWRIRPRPVDLVPLLQEALEGNRVDAALEALEPQHEDYRRLTKALAKYRAIAEADGWKKLPDRLTLTPGQRSPHLPLLAARLSATGDLSRSVADNPPETYDERLQQGVQRFAARHNLGDSTTLTRAVVGAMNVPVEQRIRQIALNMERWRWFPRDLGDRHIRVNVPEYYLEVREKDRVVLPMTVIVGTRNNPTPIFSDRMTVIVFSPYWNVPSGIAQQETLPAVLEDPGFLDRNNIEVVSASGQVVEPGSIDWAALREQQDRPEENDEQEAQPETFPYRFRQRPGTANSLGLVKFLFPNDFDVYLHDTPARTLFKRTHRALSHGCVRLEEPVKLAEYLLRGAGGWTTGRIEKAMQAGTEEHVKLQEPIPVHLMYWTARVDEEDNIRFMPDIYGHDARQARAYQSRLDRVKQRKDALQKRDAAADQEAGGAGRRADER